MPDYSALINMDTIIDRLDGDTWEEVLAKIAAYLQAHDYVSPGYRDMLILRERNFPTGLPTEPFHVAIPHTDPECVLKPCILICKLAHPVEFLDMGGNGTVQAEYTVALVIQKKSEQAELIRWVINLFSNQTCMEKLRDAQTRGEILQAVYSASCSRPEEQGGT